MHRPLIDRRYQVIRRLGSGARGEVYKAKDLKDNRIIALKILSRRETTSEEVQRFKREFSLLAGFHHPNLCRVYDFGVLRDGRSYFTMEYIDGQDIFGFTKGLSYSRIYPLVVQLCRVLEYIHAKGLIHYDIKPGNVLVGRSGSEVVVKLMDFGLAGEHRVKGGVMIKGTFPYIAPEVINGMAVDHRADLYSLGVLLYEIFGRRRLRRRTSYVSFLKEQDHILTEPLSKVVPGIPKGVNRLVMVLLALESGDRPNRANEVIKEINRLSHSRFALETEQTIEGYLLSSRFVGREREMGILKSLYEKARQGEGRMVMISGEAGIGKSRLLKEFKVFIQLRRSRCFLIHAYKDKIGPLEPFSDLFGELINYIKNDSDSQSRLALAVLFRIFPHLTHGYQKKTLPRLTPLGPEQDKLRIFEVLSELIGYCASLFGGIVLLFEDLHWADDLSIQFLEYLGRNMGHRNILICGTVRAKELKENMLLQRVARTLMNEGHLNQVELRPLMFRSLSSFLDSTITPVSNSAGLVRYLMKKTGGIPFFVEEIMRTLLRGKKVHIGERVDVEDLKQIAIPETIEDVVSNRLYSMDGNARLIIRYAAVLLKDFGYDLMKRLTNLNNTELSHSLWRLQRRQILVEDGNRFRFYHAILRDAVLKGLSKHENRRLNYRVGKILENINGANIGSVVEDLAYHFINARERKRAVSYGLRAARKSAKKYANEQAVRFYKGILGLLPKKESKLHFAIYSELAEIENLVGRYDDALSYYSKALTMKTDSADRKIKLCLGISIVYVRRGEYNKTLPIYWKALGFLRRMKPSRLRPLLEATINARICRAYFLMGDHKRAAEFDFDFSKYPKNGLKTKVAIQLQSSLYATMGDIESYKIAHGKGNYGKVVHYCRETCRYARKIGDENMIAATMINLGIKYRWRFKIRQAVNCLKKAVQMTETIGDQYGLATALCNLGNLLRDVADDAAALDCYQRALVISGKIGYRVVSAAALSGLGQCALAVGDLRAAKKYAEQALKIIDDLGLKEREAPMAIFAGAVYEAMGIYTSAFCLYRKALRISKDIRYQDEIASASVGLGSVFIAIGDFVGAKKYIGDALKIAIDIGAKNIEIECNIQLCRMGVIAGDCRSAYYFYKKGTRMAERLKRKYQILRLSLLLSEIQYLEKRYSKGIGTADRSYRYARNMGAVDLCILALLSKVKNGSEVGSLSRTDISMILDEAAAIAEEIGYPEILWRLYFAYGKFFQNGGEYLKALTYYQLCNKVFEKVVSEIRNESNGKQYLARPDRQALVVSINEIESILRN